MSDVVAVVYEQGALHPLSPLRLHEHQRVHVQILPEPPSETIEQIVRWLSETGRLTLPHQSAQEPPVSETKRIQLSRILGQTAQRPLSELILADRGE